MGEVVMQRRSALGQLLIASAAAAAIVAGCTASRPAKVVQARPAGHGTAAGDSRQSAATSASAVSNASATLMVNMPPLPLVNASCHR